MFDLSNRLYKVVVLFLVSLVIYFGFSVYINYKAVPGNSPYPEVLSVTGEGKASITPDIATVNLSITTEGVKVEDVVLNNTEKMNTVIMGIKNLEIAEKDIKTKQYSLYPRYEWTEAGKRVSRGYTLTQTVEVKIRDFAKIGGVLEVASSNGVNSIGDLQFTIDDMEKARAIARENAIAQAKEKASLIASQTGLKLKKVVSVYEDTGNNSYPIYDSLGMGSTMKEASSIAPDPTIQAGEQEITVRMTLNYRTK